MTQEEELIQLREENRVQREQIRVQQEHLAERDEMIAQLLQRVQHLEERLSKDSHNSHLPPSSDRFVRQPKSLRKKSEKESGGQPGHPGSSLHWSSTPDEIVEQHVEQCEACHHELQTVAVCQIERRQVFDVPPPRLIVREYRAQHKRCPVCQHITAAAFPQDVSAPMQYGPSIGATAVYLVQQHLLPLARACEVMQDLLGVQMSEGTVGSLITRCAAQLREVEQQIKDALKEAEVIHQDETGLSVAGQRYWEHVTCTSTLTHYHVDPSRGQTALAAIGILPDFQGISIHDGWASYWQYTCEHACCNVHLVRELTYLPPEQQPFGMGPWPCLNPICDKYLQRSIQKCDITYLYTEDGLPRGKFSCSCGFTYSRVGPDRSEVDIFRASGTKVYGPLWEAKLRSLWENPDVGTRQTKQILGVSWKTLYKQARKLGLLDYQHPDQASPIMRASIKSRTHFAEIPDPQLLEKYRTTWLSMKESHPNYGLKQIEKAISKECKWLNRHDWDWLRSQFQNIKQVEWKQKDEYFAIEVRSSALFKKREQQIPKRMTMDYILRDMPQKHIILKNLDKLPYTKQAIEENKETNEEFVLRRIAWTAECFRQEKVCPTRAQFLSSGNFYGPQARWIRVKIAIDDALRILSSDML